MQCHGSGRVHDRTGIYGRESHMRATFQAIPCYILAGGESVEERRQREGIGWLESGYRRYAALFEQVSVVVRPEQAREQWLNYPLVVDQDGARGAAVGVATALKHTPSDAIFIGSSKVTDFPLEAVVDLVKRYNGETFLGYQVADESGHAQPFGIFSKAALEQVQQRSGDLAADLSELIPSGTPVLGA